MFRSARWRSDKSKVKVDFKFQFRATQIPELNFESLIVSVLTGDAGKPAARSEKASVQDGACCWDAPVHESVKFVRDAKTGKFGNKTFRFVVSTSGSLRNVGEVQADLGCYAMATKASIVSLALKNSKYKGFLHISIQRLQNEDERRWNVETDDASSRISGSPLSALACNDFNDDIKALTMRQVLASESNGSSGYSTPNRDPSLSSRDFASKSPKTPDNQPKWGWVGDSDIVTSTDDSSQSTLTGERIEEASDVDIGKLKSTIVMLLRQVDMSELELQTLRKQIVKENKRFQEISKELSAVKQERNTLYDELERSKSIETNESVLINGESFDSDALLKELKLENANLSMKLKKAQASNAELLIAVSNFESVAESAKRGSSDDEERFATKRNGDKETSHLEQRIIDLCSEVEIYKRDKEEIEIQVEQIALDYEILKQENHSLWQRVEQSQLEEQLKGQHECCSSSAKVSELAAKIEVLEKEIDQKGDVNSRLVAAVSERQSHVKYLEDEIEERGREFEADLERLMNLKVEQEQRAIRAEDAVRKYKWKIGGIAEKLQIDCNRLCFEMQTAVDARENTVSERAHFEEMLRKFETNFRPVGAEYEALFDQLNCKTNEFSLIVAEACFLSRQLENQKHQVYEDFQAQIRALKFEVDSLAIENRAFAQKYADCSRALQNLNLRYSEVEPIKERSSLVENELREMQERYSELSVKFAEVEGERQQLVMALRTIKPSSLTR